MEERVEHSLEMLASELRQEIRALPKKPHAEDYLKIVRTADACLSEFYRASERLGAAYRDCGRHIASVLEDAVDVVLNAPPEYRNSRYRGDVLRYAEEARRICFMILDERNAYVGKRYMPEAIKRRMQSTIF